MELSPPESVEQKAEALESLISGPLASLVSRLLTRFRGIPSGKDFHFYNNFDEFKLPAREIASKTQSSLANLASSVSLMGNKKTQPFPDDLDDAYEWLVNLNDDFLDKFGVSMDEFKSIREKQECTREAVDSSDGFQLVCGKKKRRGIVQNQDNGEGISASFEIKMVSRDKKSTAPRAKVPFHIPSIPRPQNEFNIIVNNNNTPFEHVWLEKSEDKSRFIHPLEKLSVADFIDRVIIEDEIKKPLPLEATPFKLVETVKDLKDMAAKLCGVNEFAVDLEHNQYRSFLGLTCLMQISTRTEDFVVDTLKLRVHIGPYLRAMFNDPLKRKVMHGADRDILWLQRDFGIYVCNLFDTGQGSRVLQLERYSLEHLLCHYCSVKANKEYQNADWRLRPLPNEMIKYAREDTHYLLHIYDLMRCQLSSSSSDGNDLLFEVYKRSSIVCLQFYEKEFLTDTSYLHIYGLSDADFNAKQLAIVAGLCEWRDAIAREEDESTGYILPNKALLDIARQMPQSFGNLCRLVKSKLQYVECHLSDVMKIIKNAIANSFSFEIIAEEIRKRRLEALTLQNSESQNSAHALDYKVTEIDDKSSNSNLHAKFQEDNKMPELSLLEINCSSSICDKIGTAKSELLENGAASPFQVTKKVTPTVSVQVIKKPACTFGSLFGNSSRRKTNPLIIKDSEKEKNENKVAQIKASVIFPFYSFSADADVPRTSPTKNNTATSLQTVQSPDKPLESEPALVEQVLLFGNSTDDGSESPAENPKDVDCSNGNKVGPTMDADMANTNISLSDLSSGFKQCSQFTGQRKSQASNRPSQQSEPSPHVSPFDYTTARKTIKFGALGKTGTEEQEVSTADRALPTSNNAKKGFLSNGEQWEGGRQARRRQAFPPSGNRSTTYRD